MIQYPLSWDATFPTFVIVCGGCLWCNLSSAMVGEEEVVGLPMWNEPIYDGKEYPGERKFIDDLLKKKKKHILWSYGFLE